MAKNSAKDIEVKAFATHQIITQPNPLRKVLRRVGEKHEVLQQPSLLDKARSST